MMCPECMCVWEYGLIGKRRSPIYYDDFPTYKLEESKCPRCKEK